MDPPNGADGRLPAVSTTNLDSGDMRAWGPAAEAERTLETGEPDRVRRILLASSPPRPSRARSRGAGSTAASTPRAR